MYTKEEPWIDDEKEHTHSVTLLSLGWVLVLFLSMESVYLSRLEGIGKVLDYSKLVFDVIVLFMFFSRRKFEIHMAVMTMIGYQILLLGSTIINKGEVLAAGKSALDTSCFILFIDYMMDESPADCIHALFLFFSVQLIANFALLLAYPNGIYLQGGRGVWLFGQANETTLYVTCGVMLCYLLSFYVVKAKRFSMRAGLMLLICLLTTILTKSATSLVGMSIILATLMLQTILNRSLNPFAGLVASVIIFVLFILLRVQSYFQGFIIGVLHRSTDFSNRLRLWDAALLYIAKKPIIGYGVESRAKAAQKFFTYATPHNKLLYTLYQGGVVQLVAFAILIISAIIKLNRFKYSHAKSYITAVVIAFLIQMQFESYTLTPFWIPFIVGMYLDKIMVLRNE